MATPEQIAACQEVRDLPGHTINYIAWIADAERRRKSGQRQLFCTCCARWKWPGEACAAARLHRAPPARGSYE